MAAVDVVDDDDLYWVPKLFAANFESKIPGGPPSCDFRLTFQPFD